MVKMTQSLLILFFLTLQLSSMHAFQPNLLTRSPVARASSHRLADSRRRFKERVSEVSAVATSSDNSVSELKSKILQVAALTDRGQRLNTLVAPVYQENRELVAKLCAELCQKPFEVNKEMLSGEWELAYADVELFRSSPFFLAIERALDTSPGIPLLGQWLGITDPTKKSAMFFKLHQLQVLSWGASTIGRIAQKIDFESKKFESAFDTIIFGLTVIPILGWFKLLPTFGGRVVTIADSLELKGNEMIMSLEKTKVIDIPGVNRIPLVSGLLMDRWYPVRGVWKLLPWNGGPFEGRDPECRVEVIYLDDSMRITKDLSGAIFVYTRPML